MCVCVYDKGHIAHMPATLLSIPLNYEKINTNSKGGDKEF